MTFKHCAAAISMALASIATPAFASDFFDLSAADRLVTVGARLGINTSNRTLENGLYNVYNHNSWGTGLDVGAVASLNIRNFIAIQPGIFFETRSNDYTYINSTNMTDTSAQTCQVGHSRRYYFNIPILISLRMNITETLRWDVDFGPYFNLRLGKSENPVYLPDDYMIALHDNGTDIGIKMGTGLNIMRHYYVGVHYLAGASKAWKNYNGRNKCWEFTIGYNF